MMPVTKHVHALKIPFQIPIKPGVTLDRFVHVYLIYGHDRVWMVDTGVAGSEKTIFEYLARTGRTPNQVAMVIQTHSHPDHIGASRAIAQIVGCPIAAHAAEKDWIENVEAQFRERPVPGFHTLVGGSARIDQVLADGDTIDLGDGMNLKVLHTPGHSRGSISLWFGTDRALFTGDVIPLPGGIPIYDDVVALAESLKRLKAMPDIALLLPSWGEPVKGELAYKMIDESLGYLQRIHEIVIKAAGSGGPPEPMELCGRVARELRLPEAAATPLLARSFLANLAARATTDLLAV